MRPRSFLLLYATVAVAVTAAAWDVAYKWQLSDLRQQADDALSLKSRNVTTEVERYRYLPSVVAKDERIQGLLSSGADTALTARANGYLEEVNRAAQSDVLYVLDATGMTRAASNWNTPLSFVGNDYAFRPYYRDAMTGCSGAYYGVGVTTHRPGYFLATCIRSGSAIIGVATVKVDISPLEDSWKEAGEFVALVDEAGMIFLSSVDDWRFRPFVPISDADRQRIKVEQQYDVASLERAPLTNAGIDPKADLYLSVQGKSTLVRMLDISGERWRILAAYDLTPVNVAAGLVAGVALLSVALLFAAGFYLRERGQRIQVNELRAILENASVGIAVYDADLRLHAWNSRYRQLNSYPEALVRRGRPLAEIIQFNIDRGDYGPGDPRKQLQERVDRARQQPAQQTEVLRPDGTWLEIRRNLMPNGLLVHTYSDITERKRTEAELAGHRNNLERLVEDRTAELVRVNQRLQQSVEQTEAEKQRAEQANRAKTTFLNAVSHDIRNPLNAILGYAGLVMANAKAILPARQYGNLEKLTAKGRELNELVNDFIDYTREGQINTAAFRLRPLIEECLVALEPTIEADRIAVVCDVPANGPELIQDRKKLGRIVSNLLSNAAKFTEKGTVRISASHMADVTEIAVSDTGIGIAGDDLDRIFEEFERVEPQEQRKREGTGLGLAICRRFAGLMGGKITVRSKLGAGSEFSFSFPNVHPKADTGAVVAAAEAARAES
jgi:histidine kinase